MPNESINNLNSLKMKKGIFLFFSVMLLSSMSAFAQWTLPEVKTSDLVVGEVMYLYNKDAGAFMRGLGDGNVSPYWGTRAGVAVNGADSVKILPALAVNVPALIIQEYRKQQMHWSRSSDI